MYVVTGATGHTGSVVAQRLLTKGQKVRVIGRSEERLKPLIAHGAEAFVADLSDEVSLTRGFTGAKAVYVMLPPDIQARDGLAYQKSVSNALAAALEQAKVTHAVMLSSIGADKSENTGPVVGLHQLEQTLNAIHGLNVLHLRAGYFMENTLAQAGIIRATGKTGGPLRPDLKLPMIATLDIGVAAAESLLTLDFEGQQTRELLGQRDLTMIEVTTIIGRAVGNHGLRYATLSDDELRPALLQMGFSEDMARLLLEMSAALNSGHMHALEKRSVRNTTPTSYETFVTEEFVPLFRGKSRAA